MAVSAASSASPAARGGLLTRISTALYTRPGLLLLLLFALPLGYMIVVYLGSLVALLINSFYQLDDFSGKVVQEFTLKNYAALLQPGNLAIIGRTVGMAAAVTVACAVLAFPLAFYIARYASPRAKGWLYLAVLLPLWSSYIVRVYAWKLILSKEGILMFFVNALGLGPVVDWLLGLPAIGGPSLAVSAIGMFIAFVYVWLPYMVLPIQAALGARSLVRPGCAAPADFSYSAVAAFLPRRGGRFDLHFLTDIGGFHCALSAGQLSLFHRPGRALVPGHGGQPAAGRRLHRRAGGDHGDLPARSAAVGGV